MTDIISTLVPSPAALGEYIQEHVLQGYRLKDGWPIAYSWQYEVVMIKDAVTQQPVVEAKKAVGRPKAA